MPNKFVIQLHRAQRAGTHSDFRFEENGVAPSWAIPKGFSAKKRHLAIQVEDHPVQWMDFEGEITEGYGKGTVEIWEKGLLTLDERTDHLVRFHVEGGKIDGAWELRRDKEKQWQLQRYVGPGELVESLLQKEEIVAALNEICDRLKAAGENQFRAISYKNAANTITNLNFHRYDADRLMQLPGFGEGLIKTITDLRQTGHTKLLDELRKTVQLKKRFPHAEAMAVANAIVEMLRKQFPTSIIEVAGSLRRGKDPKDIDILIAGDEKENAYSTFCRTMGKNLDMGEKATSIMKEGIQVDLRIVPKDAYGAGLLFFTGSADFNIRCRAKAKTLGLHLTRYGLEDATGKVIARSTEREVLDALGIEWLEPKDRS